jgi:hypothetical protein
MFTLYVDENRDSMLLLEAIDESFHMLKRGVLGEIRKPSMLDRIFKSSELKQLPCLIGEGDIIMDPNVICEIIFVEPQPPPEPEYEEREPIEMPRTNDRFAERPASNRQRQKKPRGVVEIPDEPISRVGKPQLRTNVDDMFEKEHSGMAQSVDNSKLNALLSMPLQTYDESSEDYDIESELTANVINR